MSQYSIEESNVIRRHGTLRDELLRSVLSESLCSQLASTLQTDSQLWPGGFFGYPGLEETSPSLSDNVKEKWRKEYLPGATALLGTVFAAQLGGLLNNRYSEPDRLRVTLHRAIKFGDEELLQQTCEYFGSADGRSTESAGRTFPAKNAAIGLAYTCRKIVRTVRDVDPERLVEAMEALSLNKASRTMAKGVRFILSIPILEPEEPNRFTAPSPVVGVIYIDSKQDGFFLEDSDLKEMVAMTMQFLGALPPATNGPFDRINNIFLSGPSDAIESALTIPTEVADVFELSAIEPPQTRDCFQLNFDYADYLPVSY
jgi:hypothetical protein